MKYCITNGKVILKNQVVDANVYVENTKITEISNRQPDDETVIDAKGRYVSPGFIDVHTHGRGGSDTMYNTFEDLDTITSTAVKTGVTGILPTTMTMSKEDTYAAIKNVGDNMDKVGGSKILGVHMEGPFFNTKYKGAQPEEYCVKPNIEQFKRYQKAAHGLIKYITMAVENDEDYALTKYCSQNNVVVSIGHSNATYEQAVQAYAHGARSMTHVYNAMTPFTHRANGLVGGALRIRNMYGEIICDGNHSTLAALNNFFTSKGPDYSIMITDSLMCKGFPVGTKFDFGGQEVVIYPDGSAHLVEAGNLAGSTLNVNKGLKILIEDALVPVNYAINACTSNPARCLHVDDRKGTIGVGYDADLVVLDRDYEVVQTYCKGIGQK